MKSFIILICLVLSLACAASAQDHRGRKTPALVVVTHQEEYLTDTIGIKLLKQQGILKKDDIGNMDKESDNINKYEKDAANGIVRFLIDDKKYPNAYYHIVKTMHYIGPAEKRSH